MQSFTTLTVSNKKCGISKQKAVCLAENVGFNCKYANAFGCNMTVTICYFMWEKNIYVNSLIQVLLQNVCLSCAALYV